MCPSCGASIPEGVRRCPGCARVFGEQNRCPACHAIAPAMERKGQLICAACGAPRSADAGVEILSPASTKGASIALRVVGFTMLAAALTVAGVSALFDQYVLALILGAGFGLPGWLALGRARRTAAKKDEEKAREQERAIRALMADQAGRVTAQQVAKKLGIAVEQADALLTRSAKEGTFEVDFDDEGSVYYIDPAFSSRGARVRIDAGEPDSELEQTAANEEASKARM